MAYGTPKTSRRESELSLFQVRKPRLCNPTLIANPFQISTSGAAAVSGSDCLKFGQDEASGAATLASLGVLRPAGRRGSHRGKPRAPPTRKHPFRDFVEFPLTGEQTEPGSTPEQYDFRGCLFKGCNLSSWVRFLLENQGSFDKLTVWSFERRRQTRAVGPRRTLSFCPKFGQMVAPSPQKGRNYPQIFGEKSFGFFARDC